MPGSAHLLIVDDNAATRYAMGRVLQRHGYRVHEAGTGGEGLALLREQPIDALVLDINLPDMSGIDIARQLREDESTALLPIVHVSAAAIEKRDLISGLDAGADAYLTHPVDPEVLLATLRTLLRVRDTEHALRKSEARFRTIVQNVAAPIAVLDAHLQVRQSNPAFAALVGPCAPERNIMGCFEPGQDATLDALRDSLTCGTHWQGVLRLSLGDAVRDTQWRVSPYGTPGTGLVFVEDVTEQRRRERNQREQLRHAHDRLVHEVAEHARTGAQLLQMQKMDALGKLTGGIAHDFNNLLTGIIAGIELVNERIAQGRSDGVERFSEAALASARRAAGLTHRLLAFARRQPLDARSIDVNTHIASLEDLLRRTIGERVELELELSPRPTIAHVDAGQLENAILNLVINARDALPRGGRIVVSTMPVRVTADEELADGDYVALRVRDDGTGISPEVLDKVFDPFFTTKGIGKGTGLGLSMIYGFARQSRGRASIDSTPGEGTEVTLLLPAGEKVSAVGAVEATGSSPGHGEHLLLVEDVATVRALAHEILVDAGYRCTVAADAESAMRALAGPHGIDLLVTDVGLPGMDGRQLADIARTSRPQLPVLFLTGYAENAQVGETFLGPGMGLMTKPFAKDRLLDKVGALLADASGRGHLAYPSQHAAGAGLH